MVQNQSVVLLTWTWTKLNNCKILKVTDGKGISAITDLHSIREAAEKLNSPSERKQGRTIAAKISQKMRPKVCLISNKRIISTPTQHLGSFTVSRHILKNRKLKPV